ncbi:hypothetical protein PG984_011425 [Apiospora sp. TS-2023a]
MLPLQLIIAVTGLTGLAAAGPVICETTDLSPTLGCWRSVAPSASALAVSRGLAAAGSRNAAVMRMTTRVPPEGLSAPS